MEKITASIDSHWQEFLVLLQKVMQVPSVKGKPAHHAPYGTRPRVLDLVLSEAAAKGFKTNVIDDAIGYVQWGENSEEYVAESLVTLMLCLQEQVAGSFPPFDLTEKAGRFYGRGILDNKGPIISCLYALFLLKKSGFVPKKTIRLIFGTDEESGMSDIPHYLIGKTADFWIYP